MSGIPFEPLSSSCNDKAGSEKNYFSGRRFVVPEKVFESICSALFNVVPRFARSVLRFWSLRREFLAVVHALQISHALGRERSAPA